MSTPDNHPTDHGVIAPRRGGGISWIWLFPILAAIAASAMFYRNWSEQGPTVYVQFDSAPGIKPQKTLLYYRGVEAGTVTGIQYGKNLENVLVKISLRQCAADLVRGGTGFWIDQPVFNFAKPSGIQSLIDGNSIQAIKGNGPASYFFVGRESAPLTPLEQHPKLYRLFANDLPGVEIGSDVLFHGLPVGLVRGRGIDGEGRAYLEIGFEEPYADLIRSNARFWCVEPCSLRVGAGMFQMNIRSVKNLFLGSIAMDYFSKDQGSAVAEGEQFTLYATEQSAAAVSEPFAIEFKNAQGLVNGMSELRYLGLPVGIVDKAVAGKESVVVTARFREGYDFLRRRGAVFSIVRPEVEIPKVQGLETLVSGVYIDCIPGAGGGVADRFNGISQDEADLIDTDRDGFKVELLSASTKVSPGTLILYRGVKVGLITGKRLDESGTGVILTASIKPSYAKLLRSNSHFWNISGVKISGGLINLNVQSATLESKGLGGVEFSTPTGTAAGEKVEQNHRFPLNDSPRKEWLLWSP